MTRPPGATSRDGPVSRLEEVFGRALDLPAQARQAFLKALQEDDPALARELGELLEAHETAGDLLDRLAAEVATSAPLELERARRPTLRIGPFRILDVLGRGGMGVVYRAVRDDGQFDQEVALKLLHLDMDSPALRARFLAERQLLARLNHPNVARLLGGGVTPEERPYIVMEKIEGRPITEHCRAEGLDVEGILHLFLHVIEAVAYLHRNLIVHRDLKPGNVLVDREGRVKLLDFGVAKLLEEVAGDADPTRTGARLLTPGYAAPEQRTGDAVTTATDVYSLGVVLYELLTGERPDTAETTSAIAAMPAAPGEVARRRRRAEAAGGEPGSPPRPPAPRGSIPRDLDHVCLAALRPEPERRYSSAAELRQDLERYLEGLPVRARPSTLRYRATTFLHRYRRGVAVVSGLLALLSVGLLREIGLRETAEEARESAQAEAAKAQAVSAFLVELLSSVDPEKAQGREVAVRDVLGEAARQLEAGGDLAAEPAVEASLRLTLGTTYSALGRPAEALPHLERALALRRRHGEPELSRLEVVAAQGRARYELGEHATAEVLFRRVLSRRTEVLGEEHPATLDAFADLGSCLWQQGRFEEVEALDRRVLAIRRRILGEDHPDTVRSLNGLAATLFSLGDTAAAGELFAEALTVQRRAAGPRHPSTLMFANNLAAVQLELGRYAEAEILLEETASHRREVLGDDHADTLMTLHNLALVRAELGRPDEALPLLEGVVAARRALGGRAHPARRRESELYRGDVLADLGRFDDAQAAWELLLEELDRSSGPAERAERWRVETRLAELELERGRPERAARALREVVAQMELHEEREAVDVLRAQIALACSLAELGRQEEALPLAEQAVEEARRRVGDDRPATWDARRRLATLLADGGRREAAAEIAADLLPVLRERVGADHPEVRELAETARTEISLGTPVGSDDRDEEPSAPDAAR